MNRFMTSLISGLMPASALGNRRFHLAHYPTGQGEKATGPLGYRNAAGNGGEETRFTRTRSENDYHESVLLDESTHYLEPEPGKLFLDGTLGGGGHSEQLLKAGAKVIGLDQDPAALSFARARLSEYSENFGAIQGNFRDFGEILDTIGIRGLDGVLLDLGISSKQVDDADRGFAFSKDGPLDMRMNPDADVTAEDLVNSCEAEELARIFYQYGEERASRKIARAIIEAREKEPIITTGQLARLVEKICPRKGRTHPATKVFQALRIAVNDELRSLETVLDEVPKWLRPGGRLVVITFHSLEDRIVKTFLKRNSSPMLDRPEWPEPRSNPDYNFKLVLQKGLAPSKEEVEMNPRARSARLRVAERIA
jgi:16S rRNA (cytosine1402-N4)-methyltransferase